MVLEKSEQTVQGYVRRGNILCVGEMSAHDGLKYLAQVNECLHSSDSPAVHV